MLFRWKFRSLCALSLSAAALAGSWASANTFVRLDFNIPLIDHHQRTVFIELFDDRPLTRDNFLAYVNAGRYDGTLMHRLVSNFVLQGGGFYPELVSEPPPLNVALDPDARVDLDGNPATPNPNVPNEYTNSPTRSNIRGTLAMAKIGGNPNSATNQFFFNIRDNGGLDTQNGGFTVFAQVISNGMTLVDAYNGLSKTNLNPDEGTYNANGALISDDPDGVRDPGAFGEVAFLGSRLLILERADVVDVYQSGSSTTVDSQLSITQETFIHAGATFTGSSAINIAANGRLDVQDGATIGVGVVNGGRFEPGLSLGAVSVAGYQQLNTGTLAMELRETTAGTQHDQLNTTGTAVINGTLNVSLLSGFEPTPGDSFTLITAAGGVSGQFTTLNLPSITTGSVWDLEVGQNSVVLSTAYADYNHNGVVDAIDYARWRDTLGETVAPFTAADGNGNGMIDSGDFDVWRDNLSNVNGGAGSSGLASRALPEPGGAALLMTGLILLAFEGRLPSTSSSGRALPQMRADGEK
jgi:cyclophilin family peptidyl-prolyl cis-trans isomerase